MNIGKQLAPTEVLFGLINPSDIHLALKVFEKGLDKIRKGQQVLAFTNSRPERKLACEVILVGKDLSPERTAEVHCHFQRYEPDLLPRTFMNAELALESPMGPSCRKRPSSALKEKSTYSSRAKMGLP